MKVIFRALLFMSLGVALLSVSSSPCQECAVAHAEGVASSEAIATGQAAIAGAAIVAADLASATPVGSAAGLLPKMVDLGAGKCVACKKMVSVLEEAKKRYSGIADIEFIDVWENKGAGEKFGIRSIPTQIFFDREGKEVFRHEGFLPLEEIQKQFEPLGAKLKKE